MVACGITLQPGTSLGPTKSKRPLALGAWARSTVPGPPIPGDSSVGNPCCSAESSDREAAVATVTELAALKPERLAIMHGSSFEGDGAQALSDLAVVFKETFGRR